MADASATGRGPSSLATASAAALSLSPAQAPPRYVLSDLLGTPAEMLLFSCLAAQQAGMLRGVSGPFCMALKEWRMPSWDHAARVAPDRVLSFREAFPKAEHVVVEWRGETDTDNMSHLRGMRAVSVYGADMYGELLSCNGPWARDRDLLSFASPATRELILWSLPNVHGTTLNRFTGLVRLELSTLPCLKKSKLRFPSTLQYLRLAMCAAFTRLDDDDDDAAQGRKALPVSIFTGLTQLLELHVSGTRLVATPSDPDLATLMPRLQVLDIADSNGGTGATRMELRLSWSYLLDLHTVRVDGALLSEPLSELPAGVRVLALKGMEVKDESVQHLTALEELELDKCSGFTGAGLQAYSKLRCCSLTSCPSLESVRFHPSAPVTGLTVSSGEERRGPGATLFTDAAISPCPTVTTLSVRSMASAFTGLTGSFLEGYPAVTDLKLEFRAGLDMACVSAFVDSHPCLQSLEVHAYGSDSIVSSLGTLADRLVASGFKQEKRELQAIRLPSSRKGLPPMEIDTWQVIILRSGKGQAVHTAGAGAGAGAAMHARARAGDP